MDANIDRSVWTPYLTDFTKRNKSRRTILEVFGDNGAQTEERGLPLVGISMDKENGSPSLVIMLGGLDSPASRHLTRIIRNVHHVTPKRGLDGRDDALEIIDECGEISLLRFEPKPKVKDRPSSLNVLSSITLPPPPPTRRAQLPASCLARNDGTRTHS